MLVAIDPIRSAARDSGCAPRMLMDRNWSCSPASCGSTVAIVVAAWSRVVEAPSIVVANDPAVSLASSSAVAVLSRVAVNSAIVTVARSAAAFIRPLIQSRPPSPITATTRPTRP